MANIAVHLAVAQEWAKKHNVENMDDFLWGSVAPDILGKLGDRYAAHYTDVSKFSSDDDLPSRLQPTEGVEEFVAENGVNSDYDKGYLLHLIVDNAYYGEFLKLERLSKFSDTYSGVKPYLYQTYDATLDFVNKKYGVIYENSHEEMSGIRQRYGECAIDEEPTLYSCDELAEFIEKMSNLDLEEYVKNLQFKEEENVRQI